MDIFAVILVIAGLVNIFAGDFVWKMRKFNNDLGGVVSERTETWEVGRILGGCVMVVIGIVLLVSSVNKAREREATRNPVHVPYGGNPAIERIEGGNGVRPTEQYRVPVVGTAYDTRWRIIKYYMGTPNHTFCSGGDTFVECSGESSFMVSLTDLPTNEVLVKWTRR